MEENAELFVDPEEDEIFFYGVTEKEAQARNVLEDKMQLNAKKISENCSDKNNYAPKPTENNLQTEGNLNPFKTSIGLEQITDLNWLSNSINITPLGRDSRNEENISEKCSTTLSYQESILSQGNGDYIKSPIKEAKPEDKKLDQYCGIAENTINISEDHNYSTPVRNVIDKSILKTPKSVVKADKDGGFLKVLSEIALVKAEADENTLGDTKILAAGFLSSQELNDDNKENKKSDNERTNAITKVDVSPGKAYVKKLSKEGQKKKSISSSPEKLNEHNIDFSIISELESIKLSEDIKGPFLENENSNLQGFCTKRVTDNPADKLCLVKCLPLHEESPNKLEVVLEKLNGNLFDDSVTKERKITEKFPVQGIEAKGNDKQDDLFAESITSKEIETFEETCAFKQNLSEKETRIIPVPELKLPEVVTEEKDSSSCLPAKDSSDLERQKVFLRRNTMRLLEELNELVVSEQARRESFGTTCNTMLSEDAAKVIQKLKAVGFDDSICSPDQYFDLDKLDNSLFSNELSDALNDTLSKPLSLITNKDVESLLEKINFLEDEGIVHSANKFDPKQENLFETRNGNETEISPSFRAEEIEGAAPDANNSPSDCAISVQCENKKVAQSGFENSLIQKLPGQPEVIQNGSRECHTIDRNIKSKGLSRIPKLTSTTSKVPATTKQWKPTPSKTPLLKAVKSLKFSNIESPVSAYINSKTTVMFLSGKSKAEIKDVACMKAENNPKSRKLEFRNILPKSEAKLTSHVVKLKNGTPLKLEKSPQSRIPRSVSKVPAGKLPVTGKNDDRMQSSVLRRLDKQMRK